MLPYLYSSISESQLRLLTLLPGKFEDALKGSFTARQFLTTGRQIQKYEALSYVWGDRVESEPIAILQDSQWKDKSIGASLSIALRHLRLPNQPRVIWCDSLCINQSDLVERAAQVLRMGDIYREADRVVVWLGPEADDSSVAIETLDHIGSNVHFDPAKYELSPLPGAGKEFEDPTSSLSYTEKEWQEIVLANSSAIVVAGHSSTTWSRFGQAAGCIEVKIALGALSAPFSTRFVGDVSNAVALFRTTLFRHPIALLNFTRSCQCADERDRVYSILGLVVSGYKIQPDYTQTAKDICREFMLGIYREDSRLDILAFCDVTGSPSWVPNLPGLNPANHFWRNFATGYSEAHLNVLHENIVKVTAKKCEKVLKLIGHIPRSCAEDEMRQRVKHILIHELGEDTGTWDSVKKVKLTQALLGGHWHENTTHSHNPPLADAVSVLEGWVLENDSKHDQPHFFLEMLVVWAILNAISGWSVYQTENGLFGICSNMCLPGDHVYAILGCKDPIVLRGSEDSEHLQVVGPTYIHELSCGQAILAGDHAFDGDSTFFDSFDNPELIFERKGGLGTRGDPHLQHIDFPYKIEDDHPLWHRGKGLSMGSQTASWHLEALLQRGIPLQEITIK
ncbi:Heterokaryon incompatibility protein 6 OR allele [Lachnellula suecica]|uniref:Heterokaryon incompatibility protein 6 OR allele n=1 Tax=Lachnellula suecica TaxID=602035 RepID=A0A8T9C792_9HELO|nr:Heterokaryon incompatibility protein 6 OR allele [Lachnellula suecica]